MRRTMKTWLVVATVLVVAGLVTFAAVMSEYQWNFAKLGTRNYETNTYEITEEFHSLSMNTDTADITFVLSDDGKCRVECYEEEKARHSVTIKEDTLVIQEMDNRAWPDRIGIGFGTPKVTVYLPRAEYVALCIDEDTGDIELPRGLRFERIDISLSTGDVDCFATASGRIKIKTSTGDIRVEDSSAGALDLSTSTGGITVSRVVCEGDVNLRVTTGKTDLTALACKNLISNGNTGDISLNNVIAVESFSIRRSTGDIRFDSSDAAEIFVETDTGDVWGSLLSDKVFVTHTDTGRVHVPKTATGDRCQITTNTGDIKISVKRS